MRYKNVGTSFFCFVTKHVLDRWTERPLQYRALHYMQSHSENASMHQVPECCFQFKQ